MLTSRQAVHEQTILLRRACGLAAQTDSVEAAAIMRAGLRTLLELEAAEAAQAEQGRDATKQARAGLRALELIAQNAPLPPSVDLGGEHQRVREAQEAEAALRAQIEAVTA